MRQPLKTPFRLFVAIALIVLSLQLAGCGKDGGVATNEIHLTALGDVESQHMFGELIAQFEAKHPGIKVVTDYPPGTGDVRQKILMKSVANLPIDVVYLNDTAFPEFVAKGLFKPLDPFVSKDKSFRKSDFHPKALECGTFNGRMYALPPQFGTFVIFYNRDEFRQTARKLTKDTNNDGRADKFGCMGLSLWQYMPLVFQSGGKVVDNSGRCVLNSPQTLGALQFVKDIYCKDKSLVTRFTMPSAWSGEGVPMDASRLFSTGAVSMLFAGMNFSRSLPKDLDWDIVSPPELPGKPKYFHGGFWGYGMSSRSQNKKLAWEFIRFMVSEEACRITIAGAKAEKWGMDAPSRLSAQKEWAKLYPGKNVRAYLYCLNYPGYALSQPLGLARVGEAFSRYDLENAITDSRTNLKLVLDDIAAEANMR